MKPDRAFLFAHPAHFIALGAGAGLAPKAPGTWGTLAALPLFALLHGFGAPVLAGAAALLFALGVWAAARTGRALGVADHGSIVIDEIAAFLLVLAFVPPAAPWWLAAFVAFRAFDIVKPWPIRQAERAVGGGLGVMFDDTLAALYAIAVLWVARTALS
jgi:phosphatidylglycerophosphatase A